MPDIVPQQLAVKMSSWRSQAKDWQPWPYQEQGLKFMLTDAQCGLLLDPGMGKTSTVLAAETILLKKKLTKRALIVAPLRAVYDVWPEQVASWKDFQDLGIAILHGPKKDKILRELKPEHKIVLMNPEGLDWLLGQNKQRFKLLDADMLVIDESSKFKNSTTVRFRRLKPYLMQFKRRYILTGSPRPRNYEDLFGQIYIIDRGIALGQYVSHYRNQFFFPTGFEMREWELLPGSAERINKLVAPMVLRMDARDHLKLPGTPDRIHTVELPLAARREYDAIEDSLMSTLFDTPLQNSASARAKCCQIANGAVYIDPTREDWQRERPYKVVHSAKIDALVDLYDELQGEPILVSIGYHHDVSEIRKAIGSKIPCINGGVSRTAASDFISNWNAGKYPIMLIHPASGGHGLNLQASNCRHVCFFNIPDDYDQYDQMFRRVWRQGNKSSFVFRHHIIAADTVDKPKMKNLERKGQGQADFLQAMKEYAIARGYNKPRRK